ncbi:spindle pole body formation-associated protein-domain-containing protein [Xylariaceae sp. FL0804]|nr:spindle pole body formation-associated protein-domain-containing protein [Xylariaceae sp. FL0804]
MLGWALKKGFQGATGHQDAPDVGDTTQLEGPDTPAPVFAARAIKNALWGASAASAETATASAKAAEPAARPSDPAPRDFRSPSKPNSILLTPGTATARRKRVSFGRDVKAGGSNIDSSPLAATSTGAGRPRRRTNLQQALENSRSVKTKDESGSGQKGTEKAVQNNDNPEPGSEDEWEDDVCNLDVTVDLNEPHSQSGKYWKSEFNRYRDEAKVDIERLVKYKANTKSFAEKKDAEASRLAQKLREEQTKVARLEESVAEMAAQIGGKRKHGGDRETARLMKELAKQTALAVQYHDQVKELEGRLKDVQNDSTPSRPHRRHINTSPRTEQSLLDANRELRKARLELREVNRLREEVSRVKSDLAHSREKVAKLESERTQGEVSESSQLQELKRRLRDVKEESLQKGIDVRKLRKDYESLKKDAKARTVEAMQVVEEKNSRIAELEKTIRSLEAANTSKIIDEAIAEHHRITRDLKLESDSRGKSSRHEKPRRVQRPTRSASVEDMTLDMTQRSLLGDENQPTPIRSSAKLFGRPGSADWPDSLHDIEQQLKREKKEHMEAGKREKREIVENLGVASPAPTPALLPKKRTLLQSSGKRRITSDVLSDRANQPASKVSTGLRHSPAEEPFFSDNHHDETDRRPGNARGVPRSKDSVATLSADGEGIDLVESHFTRLGGRVADRNSSANSSRCNLSADRRAAALARLDQKKRERRKAGGHGLDKENLRPEVA